jgi:hypothetical protein
VALSGRSIALVQAGGDRVEIRDVPTWKLERRLTIAGIWDIRMSKSYLAVYTSDGVVAVYRRSDGELLREIVLSNYGRIALSDVALAIGERSSLSIVRPSGATTPIWSRGPVDDLAIAGRRVVWRSDTIIRTVVLPR